MRRARPLWSVVMSLSASLLASALAHAALPADPSRVPVITGRPPIPAALGGPAGNAAAAPMGVEFLVDTSSTRIRFDVGRRLHSDGVNYAPALVAAVVDLDHDAWPEVVSTSPACAALTIHSDVAADEAERVSTLALPGAAFGLATGDVDGDGNTDVAVTLWDTARLAVLRGNGNGTFQAPNTAVLGPDPRGVTLADLDGDAVLDAAVACAGDNTVRTFHGRGDGAFDSTGTYGVGESPLQVIAADLDGDGRRDLVSVDATGRTLSCLMNLGGGAFAPATRFGLPGSTLSGDRAFAAAAGDLDGDGAVDLAVSTSWGGLLMMGDGKGGLVPSDAITTKGDAFDGGVAIADLDGDGRPDVLLGGPNHADLTSSGSVVRFALVHVFRGLGGGAFERVAGYHACYYQQSITVGDLDLDGRPDVLSAGTDTYWPRERATGLSVLMNRGGGRLGEVIELGLPDPAAAGAQYQPGPGARALHLDGPLDDLLATRGDRTFLFVNRGARGFAEPVDLGAGDFTVAGDLDGDGRDDVLWRAGNTCSLLRGLAGHALDAPRPVLDGVALLTIGRLDADAAPDAVVLGADGRVAIAHGDGTGGFGAPVTTGLDGASSYLVSGTPTPRVWRAVDLDGDGLDELLCFRQRRMESSHFDTPEPDTLDRYVFAGGAVPSDSSHHAVTWPTTLGWVGDRPAFLLPADFDGDGLRDLFLMRSGWDASGTVGTYSVFMNSGGTVHESEAGLFYREAVGAAVADLDGDRRDDVVISSIHSDDTGYLQWMMSRGDGTFARGARNDLGDYLSSVAVGRFDADERPDVAVTADRDRTLNVVFNATAWPDHATAIAATLVAATLDGGVARLEWATGGGPDVVALVQRAVDGGEWADLVATVPDGDGRVRVDDASVTPGHRYGYRVAFDVDGVWTPAAEAWLDAPRVVTPVLALAGAVPNPVEGELTVAFTLAARGTAALTLFDLAGRRVAARDLSTFEPGAHRVALAPGGALAPGLYLIRLTTPQRTLVARAIVVR